MISSSTLQGHCHPWSSLQRPQKSCLKSDHFNTEQNKNQSMGWPRRRGCCCGRPLPAGGTRPARKAARAQLPFHQADIFIPIKKCGAAATFNQTGANPEKWTFHSCPAPEMRKGGKETRPSLLVAQWVSFAPHQHARARSLLGKSLVSPPQNTWPPSCSQGLSFLLCKMRLDFHFLSLGRRPGPEHDLGAT